MTNEEKIKKFFSCRYSCEELNLPAECKPMLEDYCCNILPKGHKFLKKMGMPEKGVENPKGCSRCRKNALKKKYQAKINKILND